MREIIAQVGYRRLYLKRVINYNKINPSQKLVKS